MVHNTKAAAPSSAQVCVGLLRMRTMDPTTSRGPWKSTATHWERNWWCLQDLCPRRSCWVSPGLRHRRSDRGWIRCFRWLLVPKGSICLLVSAKSPGTNSLWNRMSAQKRTSSQACHSSREGYVWIVGVLEVAYEEKREKKTYTKNQPRAVLSVFPSGNTFLSSCSIYLFILGQCLNVQQFEHVIWLQKVFVWLKRSLSGWHVLWGQRGWISPEEPQDRLQAVMAGSTAWATSVFHQGPQHPLVTFLAAEVGQQSFSMTPVLQEHTEHWHRVWALWVTEDPEVPVCKSSIPGGPQSTHLWHRWEGDGPANPTTSPQLLLWVCPEPTQKPQGQHLVHSLSWTSPLARSYWCFVLH